MDVVLIAHVTQQIEPVIVRGRKLAFRTLQVINVLALRMHEVVQFSSMPCVKTLTALDNEATKDVLFCRNILKLSVYLSS